MGRVIKFRAWDGKKIILPEGSYDGLESLCIDFEGDVLSVYLGERGGATPIENYKLMQFTGLTDKNGKETFEGDIVKFKNSDYVCRVEFIQGCFCFRDKNRTTHPMFELSAFTTLGRFEVIGNIYESPELLKGNV